MDDYEGEAAENPQVSEGQTPADENAPQSDAALVRDIQKRIKDDKKHHEPAFKRMLNDMYVVAHGAPKDWPKDNYKANIVGRHIKQRTAALYAKNPKASARRRETLDFALWDESPESLMTAMQLVSEAEMMAQQAMAAAPVVADPMTGAAVPIDPATGAPMRPQMPPGYEEAKALVEDARMGMQRRTMMKRFGKTLEVIFAHAVGDQNPLDFKTAMKRMVRRTCTTGVGYIKLGFQRQYGLRPDDMNKLADSKTRLEHLERLVREAQEGEIEDADAEMAELRASIEALQNSPGTILREGLVFSFPPSTKVIPDKLCKELVGFVGARHITIEHLYTCDRVKEVFGVDLGKGYTPYTVKGRRDGASDLQDDEQIAFDFADDGKKGADDLVCVWEHYDKASGSVYYVADGYSGFLQPPDTPDVYVDDFWPVRALTFNDTESEDELFPPSDTTLLLDMQQEINRSRQGLREHRDAARPRWVGRSGMLEEEELAELARLKAFGVRLINLDPAVKLIDAFEPFPTPGVDPNLYETNPFFADMQLVAAAQSAQLGGVSRATATETAIAADSTSSSDSSGVDDLDSFLTWTARSSGQILLREMSPERVAEVAGPGAAWPGVGDFPGLTLEQLAGEVFLEVEAGSSGKPNQAVEVRNIKELLPFLLQIPGISPLWIARETLRRLDDKLDVTEALSASLPSIMAQNRMAQVSTGNAATDPNAQGDQGGDRAPPPGGPTGTGPAFGNNQV